MLTVQGFGRYPDLSYAVTVSGTDHQQCLNRAKLRRAVCDAVRAALEEAGAGS